MEKIKTESRDIEEYVKEFKERIFYDFYKEEIKRDMAEYILYEMLNNAYEHGNKKIEEKEITVEWDIDGEIMTLSVMDEGDGFIPRIPDSPPPIWQPRGRGLWSIREDAQTLSFNKKANKITVTLAQNGGNDGHA